MQQSAPQFAHSPPPESRGPDAASGEPPLLPVTAEELAGDPVYVNLLRAYGKRLVEIVLAGVLVNLFGLLLPLYSRLVYDKVIGNHIPETLWALTIGMLLFVVLEFVLRLIRAYYVEHLAGKFDTGFDDAVVRRLLAARIAWPVGTVLARYRDFSAARDLLSSSYMLLIIDFPFLLLYLVALGLLGGATVWVVLIGGVLLVAAQYLCKVPASDYAQLAMQAGASKTDKLAGLVAGLETLKTSTLHKRVIALFRQDAGQANTAQAKARFWTAVGYTVSASAHSLISVGTLVVGVYLVEASELTVGALIAASMLAARAATMLSSVALVLSRFDHFRQARSAFDELFADAGGRTAGAAQVDRQLIEGRIQVTNLSFSIRPGEAETLRQISLTIQPGEKVGIVGRSGSGKSTLLRCLANVHLPDAGTVLYDGIALDAYPQAVRQRFIAYKPQDPFLFDGTLAANIFADNVVSTPVYQTALAVSCVDELVASGQLRLDQVVKAPGNLSGGQRQMLALARTVSTMPNVLLLDEPTNGIDRMTENRIIERLMGFAVGRTLVVATHSHALLRHMDRIIVIDGGRIIADGPRAQLLQEK